MQFENILLEKREAVATIIINRPPLNVLTINTMHEIAAALEELRDEPGVKVVVLRGAGDRAFSAGVDVADHTPEKLQDMIDSLRDMWHSLISLDKPNIAVVNGVALGGGCELAMYCDMIIASERSQFGQPEIKVGVFANAANVMLPRLIGRKKALEMLLTGDPVDAREAERIGLVNKVVAEDKLEEELGKLVSRLADKSQVVLKWARRSIYDAFDLGLEEALTVTDQTYVNELMRTEDAVAGIKAFLEKERPEWKGR